MKPLKTTLLILTLVMLTVQAARHVYVRFIEPRTSVLDRFDETKATEAIRSAASLSDLLAEFEPAKARTDQLDAELKEQLDPEEPESHYDIERMWHTKHEDEYDRASELRRAIQDWEEKSKEILELRVFWGFGLILLAIGVAVYAKGMDWIGMALIISGFLEMIWCTSPSIGFFGSPVEFDRLLNHKLFFTAISIVLLIALWRVDKARTASCRREMAPGDGD